MCHSYIAHQNVQSPTPLTYIQTDINISDDDDDDGDDDNDTLLRKDEHLSADRLVLQICP